MVPLDMVAYFVLRSSYEWSIGTSCDAHNPLVWTCDVSGRSIAIFYRLVQRQVACVGNEYVLQVLWYVCLFMCA